MNNFLNVIKRKNTDRMPIWIMRQAGRYLPEYLEISSKHTFLEMCHNPILASEITKQPLDRFDLDAAILFSDILTPLIPMGIELDYLKGTGPVISNPIKNQNDVDNLKNFSPKEKLNYIQEAITILKKDLPDDIPLLGFCGSPFTLASYMIEGGSSKTYSETFKLLGDEKIRDSLLNFLADHIVEYLNYKIESGVDAVQIFESSGGILSSNQFKEMALPYLKKVFKGIKNLNKPVSLYIHNGCHLVDVYGEVDADIASLDWRINLRKFKDENPNIITQGNLNPSTLFAGPKNVINETKTILDSLTEAQLKSHIFNLGHGILPKTPIESVEALIDFVHQY
ncbi:MAG: uroporphyrinogen decarboxylase [Planctomycetota bacterium]|nr:MAG: uroporphyrinogen decarboxylase [Planctomycetota bacterium]